MFLRKISCALLACSLTMVNPASAIPEAPIPELVAKRSDLPPVIDGKLDEACWQTAAVTSPFWKLNGSAQEANSAKAQVVFDDTYLTIGFRCPLKDAAKVAATLSKESVWSDETVEIFLSPAKDKSAYYHFAVNAVNARFAEMNYSHPWSNPWQSATHVGADEWTAEIRIPFASLTATPGEIGSTWKINLTKGATCWAPTFGLYHRVGRFGNLVGLDVPFSENQWNLGVDEGNLAAGDSDIRLQLQQNTGKRRKVNLLVEFEGDKTWKFEQQGVDIRNGARKTVRVPSPARGKRQYVVTISDPMSGKPLAYYTSGLAETKAITAVWDRSVYLSEKSAGLSISSTIKGTASTTVQCLLKPVNGQQVVQQVNSRLDKLGRGKALFNLQKLPVGEYVVGLQGAQGVDLGASTSPVFKKLPLKAGAVQYTDQGTLLRDGKPIFPIGVYYVRPYFPRDKNLAPEYASAGFNTYPMDWGSAEEYIAEVKDQQTRGVLPIVGIQNADELQATKYEGPQSIEKTLPLWATAARTVVKKVADGASDGMLAWYTWDEPPLGVWLDWTRSLHQMVHEEDPYHPTMMVSNDPGNFRAYAADATDILGIDPYPAFPDGRVRIVSDWVDAAVKAAGHKPVIAALQTFHEEWGKMPTPEEIRCMTYLSIVHGAKGVLYFSYDYRPGPMSEFYPETWKTLKGLAREVQTLEPSLTVDKPSGFTFEKSGSTNIDVKILGRYLIAVNGENLPATASFSAKNAKRPIEGLKVFGENRTVDVKDGRWSETFAPYAVHIYELQ